MIIAATHRATGMGLAGLAALVIAGMVSPASAQSQPAPASSTTAKAPPAAASGTRIERLQGVWVEGPGYKITYGKPYDACAASCLSTDRCRMIEYYRPEKKCNLYDSIRPRLKGGSSIVGIRK